MVKIKYLITLLIFFTISNVYAQTSVVNNHVNNILKSYFGIKNALVADNLKLANSCGKEFTNALKELSSNELDAKQKTTWLIYSEKLRFDGEHISESDKIAHQREHFASLSKNMLAVLKAFKANTATVYGQYCPMKKEWWLSETSVIKNPYYGKSMEECGVTKETLMAN
jgi:hypothetical protein